MPSNRSDIERNLSKAFESGYSNAADSLAQLIKNKAGFSRSTQGVHGFEVDFFTQHPDISTGDNRVITTEIFGDVAGKSYLYLTGNDFNLLSAGIPESKDPSINLKEEFLKELDNILSASVITKLSNELKLKMFGDVPVLVENVNCKIGDIIYDDFMEETEAVYINSTFFSFENNQQIKPFFVWVLDHKILSIIEAKV